MTTDPNDGWMPLYRQRQAALQRHKQKTEVTAVNGHERIYNMNTANPTESEARWAVAMLKRVYGRVIDEVTVWGRGPESAGRTGRMAVLKPICEMFDEEAR